MGWKKETCSPVKEKNHTYTCYDSEALHTLKQLWNARHRDDKINTNDAKEIWKALRKKMTNVCDSESCWLRQEFAKQGLGNNIKSYTFAPEAPPSWKKNKNEWLTSTDIENVMKQYEKHDASFSFFGPSPIDFDSQKLYGECVWEELCHFSLLEQLKKNKKKYGMVFNLDEHWKPGSHWVSLFVDVPSSQICYFDSGGDDIPKEVMTLVERIKHQGKNCGIDFVFDKNYPFEHQMEDTECGIYSLYFIATMIKNPSFSRFKNKRIPDKEMERHRNIFFRL